MTRTTKHTPGPWTIDPNERLPLAIIQDNEDGEGICEIGARTRENLANAELIVRAVNSYSHLVRACRLLVDAYAKAGQDDGGSVDWDDIDMAHDAAQLALGIAEGKP